MTENSALSEFALTPYGVKYASLLKPRLIGNVFTVQGATLP